MQIVYIQDKEIKLGQALKLSGIAGSGVEAKVLIQTGQIKLNGAVEQQRGKKLHHGDEVECMGRCFRIEERQL